MNDITKINRKKREESTVYAVRQKLTREDRARKAEYLRIPEWMWGQWDYICNRYGIPKSLWKEWDSMNRQYGKIEESYRLERSKRDSLVEEDEV